MWQVRQASIPGREHIRLWRNNQDGIKTGRVVIEKREYLFGVISDGCSEGEHTEVGAKLLAEWAIAEMALLLSAGVAPIQIPTMLFQRAINYLRGIAGQTVLDHSETVVNFIKDYLLCTFLAYVIGEENCLIFWAGDGVVVVNDYIHRISQENKPTYLAYHVIGRMYLEEPDKALSDRFTLWRFPTDKVQRLAICTDGMEESALPLLWRQPNSTKLGRELKGLSRMEARLADDCSVIVVERV